MSIRTFLNQQSARFAAGLPSRFAAVACGILALGLLATAGALAAAAPPRPNIMLLMGDDHGWEETSYNGHPHVKTPVLDEMAATGLRLDRFYSAHPSCSPTRASVLTGRHPNRCGTFAPGCSLRPEEISIAKLLRQAGYATGHFGKWHVGPVKAASPTSPGAMGFDEWVSHDNFFEMNPLLSRNGGPPEQFTGEGSAVIVAEALKFIGKAAASGKPFFTVVWFGSPHEPYSGLPEDLALYDQLPDYSGRMVSLTSNETGRQVRRPMREVLRERYAEITAMDRAIGQLRVALKEQGLRDNTLVWYCGDNGISPDAVPASRFRQMKGTIYEGGTRVPGVIEWPARIPKPRAAGISAVTSDMLPTLCELTGTRLPNRPLDGISLVPVLDGTLADRPRPICFWEFAGARREGRRPEPYIDPQLQQGTTPLVKLAGNRATRNFSNMRYTDTQEGDFGGPRAIVDNSHKLVIDGGKGTGIELFDLRDDPGETKNLAEAQPAVAAALQTRLREWQESVLKSLRGEDYQPPGPPAAPTPAEPVANAKPIAAAPAVRPAKDSGDLTGNLNLLNLFGEQPQPVQQLYAAAYQILAAKPGASFADLAADGEIARLCAAAGVTHFGGPLLGALRPDGVTVWLRTLRPATVEVRVQVDGQERVFGPVASTVDNDLAVLVPVTGLQPATRYPYRVLIDGKPISVPPQAALTTAPADATTGQVRIAFGSCFHRWGLGNPRQAEQIRLRQPAALLLYGDIAVQDRRNHLGLHRADYLLRDFHPAWQNLVASVPVYATWDDHDYFHNDLWGIPKGATEQDRRNVWDVFRHAWNNPAYGLDDDSRGLFFRTRIGPCDVIMLDNRYCRAAPGTKPGGFLGPQQMQWLETQLLDCKGPFILLSSGTMWSDYVTNGKDSWGKFDPEGRERIFSLIEKHRIPGVILLSGDRHGARGFRIPRPSGFSFYEFEPASLGGRGDGPPATSPQWDTQLFGFAGKYAFGELSVDATLPDPTAVFRLVHESGGILHELQLTRSQLTPPPAATPSN
jgi:arylsulfatase A-like enzyme